MLVFWYVDASIDVEALAQYDAALLVGDSVVGTLRHRRAEFLFSIEVFEARRARSVRRIVEYDKVFLFLAALLVQLVK